MSGTTVFSFLSASILFLLYVSWCFQFRIERDSEFTSELKGRALRRTASPTWAFSSVVCSFIPGQRVLSVFCPWFSTSVVTSGPNWCKFLASVEDLETCLAVAVDVAKKAGQIIKDGFHIAKAVEHKGMVSTSSLENVSALFLPSSVQNSIMESFYRWISSPRRTRPVRTWSSRSSRHHFRPMRYSHQPVFAPRILFLLATRRHISHNGFDSLTVNRRGGIFRKRNSTLDRCADLGGWPPGRHHKFRAQISLCVRLHWSRHKQGLRRWCRL